MTVSNTSVLIVGNDFVDFPDARRIAVGEGLAFSDGGPQGPYTISPGGRLSSLANNVTSGYISFNSTSQTYVSRTFAGGAGIVLTQGNGVGGATSIAQIPSSVVQKVNVTGPAGSPGNYSNIKFAAGAGMSVSVVDEGAGANALVTFTNTHGDEGSVDSVDADSSTGVLVTGTPALPITESGTIHINLPGSGTLAVVEEGDSLVGGGAGEYVVVAIGATGTVPTSDGTTWTWEAPTEGTVTSIDADSSTGVLVTGTAGLPITESGTIHINLPGSGTLAVVEEGDMLLGGPAGEYVALNLDDPEVALGLGVMSASNPLYADLGDGTLTILNQYAAPDTNAGNLVLAIGDTSAASNATVASNVVSFSGTATDLAAHRFYASGGSSATPAALATTENVAIEFWGQYDATLGHYAKAASIVFAADAAFSATDEHQSSISFKVSPTGETDPLDALVLSPDLSVTIPGTLNAGSLDLGTPLGTTEGGSGGSYANQPALFEAISPITSQGDTIVGGVSGVPERLAGNASTTVVNFFSSLNNTSFWTQSIWQAVGTESTITTTRVVNTPFAGTGSTRIQLDIQSMAGSPTVSPSCYLGTVVPGVSFEIVPVAVGGGGGKATSINVLWTISYG